MKIVSNFEKPHHLDLPRSYLPDILLSLLLKGKVWGATTRCTKTHGITTLGLTLFKRWHSVQHNRHAGCRNLTRVPSVFNQSVVMLIVVAPSWVLLLRYRFIVDSRWGQIL
jgi:hypothetical protein